MSFNIEKDCIVTALAGYFETSLTKNICVTHRSPIVDNDESECLPIMYFPLTKPQSLTVDSVLDARFDLTISSEYQKLWHEWCIDSPDQSGIHNDNEISFCSFN